MNLLLASALFSSHVHAQTIEAVHFSVAPIRSITHNIPLAIHSIVDVPLLLLAPASVPEEAPVDTEPTLAEMFSGTESRIQCGKYVINKPLIFTSNSMVVLDGVTPNCVTFEVNFATGDIFQATGTNRIRVKNITINAMVRRTSGAVFHLRNTYDAEFDGVTLTGPNGGDGWLVDGANTTHISNFDCRPPIKPAVKVYGAGACIHMTGDAVDLHISHGNSASWHYGIEFTYGSGAPIDSFDAVESGNAIIFDPGPHQFVNGVGLTTIYGDTSAADNWLFAGTGQITDIQILNAWASNSQSATGMAFNNPAIDGIQCTNCLALDNYSQGISILQGQNIDFSNVHAEMNSRKGMGRADDVYIGVGALSTSFTGGMTGRGGTISSQGVAVETRYGVYVQTGGLAAQNVTVIGIRGKGHVIGATSIPSGNGLITITNLGNSGD